MLSEGDMRQFELLLREELLSGKDMESDVLFQAQCDVVETS